MLHQSTELFYISLIFSFASITYLLYLLQSLSSTHIVGDFVSISVLIFTETSHEYFVPNSFLYLVTLLISTEHILFKRYYVRVKRSAFLLSFWGGRPFWLRFFVVAIAILRKWNDRTFIYVDNCHLV